MKKYEDFKVKVIGKLKDYNQEVLGQAYDKDTANQCVDLVHFWMKEIGSPVIMGDAILLKGNHSGYVWTANSKTNFPSQGDIIVFQIGKYGHTGVVESSNSKTVDVLNENYPLKSPVKVTRFDYQNPLCLGWLHPTVLDVVTPVVEPTPPTPVVTPPPAPSEPPVEVLPPEPVNVPVTPEKPVEPVTEPVTEPVVTPVEVIPVETPPTGSIWYGSTKTPELTWFQKFINKVIDWFKNNIKERK